MSPDGEERAKGVDLPSWWLEKVRELVDEREGESLTQLGIELAKTVGREQPWDHSSVSRFLRNQNTTVPMAIAFAELLGLPRPFFIPRSLDEALSLQQVVRKYDAREVGPAQAERLASMDNAARLALDEAKGHTARVSSTGDERAVRGRRVGRAHRSRPPTS
jgi:hypothetical protein